MLGKETPSPLNTAVLVRSMISKLKKGNESLDDIFLKATNSKKMRRYDFTPFEDEIKHNVVEKLKSRYPHSAISRTTVPKSTEKRHAVKEIATQARTIAEIRSGKTESTLEKTPTSTPEWDDIIEARLDGSIAPVVDSNGVRFRVTGNVNKAMVLCKPGSKSFHDKDSGEFGCKTSVGNGHAKMQFCKLCKKVRTSSISGYCVECEEKIKRRKGR